MNKKSTAKKNARKVDTIESKESNAMMMAEPEQVSPVVQQAEIKKVCASCGSDKTTKRMNGKERWHNISETEVICHYCYTKACKGDD